MPKAVHLLVNQMLPERLRSNDREYNKKEVNELVREVSVEDPDRYASFVNSLKDLGRKSVYLQGSTLRLDDFEAAFDKQAVLDKMDAELAGLDLIKDDERRQAKRMEIYTRYTDKFTDLALKHGKQKGSALAGIIASGARGNPSQYRSMIATPGVYMDYKKEPIDMFVRRSFAEGVRPIDYLASTFGTRSSVIATKNCLYKGTLVRMSDQSLKPIESIVTGDSVMGSDEQGNLSPVKVTKTFDQGLQEVFEYMFSYADSVTSNILWAIVRCTEDHKVLQTKKEGTQEVLPIREAESGERKMLVVNGRGKQSAAFHHKVSQGLQHCYDIEIDNDSHLFVLESGIVCSNSTADAGDLGKLLVQNALPIMVNQERSSTPSGIMLDPDEDELRGRVLARSVAGYPPGTVVSRKVEAAIRNKHKGRVMVYSPLSEIGGEGISGEAFGVDYTGNIPGKGFAAGVTAGNSISEPIAQCLDAYTRVRMSDNNIKFICDIEPGEFVLGADKEGNSRPVEVLNRFDNGIQDCYEYTLSAGEDSLSVVCTTNHKVLQQRDGGRDVAKISEADKYDTPVLCNVNGITRELVVTDVKPVKTRHVFDLEVDHPDHLFELANGLIVSNSSLNSKHCILEDTKVLVRGKGEIPIKEVQIGDFVIGVDSDGSRCEVGVIDIIDQGDQDVYTYEFRRRHMRKADVSITCTQDHKVYTKDGIVPIEKVDSIRLPAKSDVKSGVKEPLAFFAGMFMGDGIRWNPNKLKGATLKVSCADPTLIEDFNTHYKSQSLTMRKLKASFDCSIVDSSQDKAETNKLGQFVLGTRSRAKKLIERLCWKGCYAHEKFVPQEVFSWDKESVAAFVSGFIATDGSIYKKNAKGGLALSFSSCSKHMLVGLRQLLWVYFGTQTTGLTRTSRAHEGFRVHDQWQFTITADVDLASLAPHLDVWGCKSAKMDQLKKQVKGLKVEDHDAKLFSVTHVGTRRCFDLTVDSKNSLFALANGMVVKNSGGAYSGGRKVFSGFDYLSQFVQVPDSFKDRAAVSEVAGRVQSIEDAPQGGKYVTVNDERHYVLPDMEVLVKPGDEVEPGDILSDGLANPKDIIRLRGLGEGRRYYSRRLKQLLDDSDQPAQLRNTEVIARGSLDAVKITDPDFEGHTPDSVTSYNRLEADWKPREGHEDRLTRQSEGRYLETPLLHYTIGTKLTPRMLNELEEAGYEKIKTHHKPPPFEPLQIRLRTQSYEVNPDWLARTGSSYLQKNLAESAQRGYDTNLKENPHPYPRLAVGEGFGSNIKDTGKF